MSFENPTKGEVVRFATIVGIVLVGIFCLLAWGCPHYKVWQDGMSGEAKLRESESSRKIAVEEAKAKLESAKLLAQAEIEKAKGAAEANKILGDSLKDNHEYLVYLWIQELSNNPLSVIYVPTEGGLPILEASRLQLKKSGSDKMKAKK